MSSDFVVHALSERKPKIQFPIFTFTLAGQHVVSIQAPALFTTIMTGVSRFLLDRVPV